MADLSIQYLVEYRIRVIHSVVADVVDICAVSQEGAVGEGQGFFAGHPGKLESRAIVQELVSLIIRSL